MASFTNLLSKPVEDIAHTLTRKDSIADFTGVIQDDAGTKYMVIIHDGLMDFNLYASGQKAATMKVEDGAILDKHTGAILADTSYDDFHLVYNRLIEAYNYVPSENAPENSGTLKELTEETAPVKSAVEELDIPEKAIETEDKNPLYAFIDSIMDDSLAVFEQRGHDGIFIAQAHQQCFSVVVDAGRQSGLVSINVHLVGDDSNILSIAFFSKSNPIDNMTLDDAVGARIIDTFVGE